MRKVEAVGVAGVILLLTVLGAQPSLAQVPGIINYQGRVTVAGTNFNGTGSFSFQLVDGTGASQWAGSASLPVLNGTFSVMLGDPNLGMPSIASSVFTNSDVRLRVWFNGQQLDPDQRIGAAGYAMTAANLLMQQGSNGPVLWSVAVGNFTDPGGSGVYSNFLMFSHNGEAQIMMTPDGGLFVPNELHLEGDLDALRNAHVEGDFSVNGNGGAAWCATFNGGNTYVGGDLAVGGDISSLGTKDFVQPHPADPTKEIAYTCLEGPEAGTYVRSSAEMVNGQAVINLPDHFGMVTSTNGLTVQLTPRGTWLELYVTTATVTQVTVGEAQGRSGQFDYLVQGVRLGYENKPVIRERKATGAK